MMLFGGGSGDILLVFFAFLFFLFFDILWEGGLCWFSVGHYDDEYDGNDGFRQII